MPESIYQVYALRYATHAGRRAVENFVAADPHEHANMPLDFFTWVIKSEQRVIVVDTGCTAERAAERQRTYLHAPHTLLTQIGIDPHTVDDVIITHMHYDHAGNLGSFPRARIHVQEDEMAYCTGPCMGHKPLRGAYEVSDIAAMLRCVFQDRVVFHRGSSELADGIWLHQLGGHTRGLQVVQVTTSRGQVALASDAVHYWANIRERRPFPILVDMAQVLAAYARLERMADGPYHIIPGHDPEVMTVFPTLQGAGDIALLHMPPVVATTSRTARPSCILLK
nr:N-acyl homoserine lactonase family protein [uncultured Duganella sp.]